MSLTKYIINDQRTGCPDGALFLHRSIKELLLIATNQPCISSRHKTWLIIAIKPIEMHRIGINIAMIFSLSFFGADMQVFN